MRTVLRGATLVDGTGARAAPGDVVVEGDTVTAVGEVGEPAGTDRVIELAGLVLAPGFIDPHTHYDAQVLWDPDLTPSSWHGVTTVVLGNCGFGVAPVREADRHLILLLLENVEGMTLEALQRGIAWEFETFPDYLAVLRDRPNRLNRVALLGHTPLRYFVMGEQASERVATPEEVATMARLLGEALDAGAGGFSTSRSTGALGAYGRPVPSRLADLSEIWALADVLGAKGKGTMVAASGPDLGVAELSALARRIGRPLSWCALMASSKDPHRVARVIGQLDAFDDPEVYPQIACRPIVAQITLADPDAFANIPRFAEILTVGREDRRQFYADPIWRDEAYRQLLDIRGDVLASAVVSHSRKFPALVDGATMGELAHADGRTPLDAMAELSLADDLETRFRFVLNNDDEVRLADLLRHPRFMVGLSDAGAHATQLCDAGYTTHLLGQWCRDRRAIDLEQAVWRLTVQPAAAFGLADRGRIAPGYRADLVAFDPVTVDCGPPERVWDQPGGTDRLVSRSRGIEFVWVNGVAVREAGSDLDAVRPGRLLGT